ncbi:MAG: Zn-ribbon domain-containing OB-fold protein [SAR202 cluster bacterium]|nr:Zn-ribbon domain-containing OB-fold protein [SAR202 cluster bacterium]|tara:strand:- start:18434 stop:18856 length:423 start_codon:yes stop_codon:yes gene_type:complete
MATEQQPYRKPLPELHPEIAPYYTGGLRAELMIKFCPNCNISFHYPRTVCPECLKSDTVWRRASGKGTVYSYTITYQNLSPGFREEVPYVLALVDLAEGVRVMTNIIDCDPKDVSVGMPVEVTWERAEELAIPKFRPQKS